MLVPVKPADICNPFFIIYLNSARFIMEESGSCERTFTIVPIEGMEAIQKNFAYLKQDGAAENFLSTKKLTLARRFQLIERGFVLRLKDDNRKSIFDHVSVQMSFGAAEKARNEKENTPKADEESTTKEN